MKRTKCDDGPAPVRRLESLVRAFLDAVRDALAAAIPGLADNAAAAELGADITLIRRGRRVARVLGVE